jgi:Fic family protein
MKSFENKFIEQQYPTHNLLKIISSIKEYKGKQDLYKNQSPQILNNLKDVATIQSTESSNRIEGIVAPHKRIVELVREKTIPKSRPEEEIYGYTHALGVIHQNHKQIQFSENLVLQIHQEIYRYTPKRAGSWKNTDNLIEEEHEDGSRSIRFRPLSAFLTPDAMSQLHQEFNARWEANEVEQLLLIATYVFDFLCIHPFSDGNGRLSRLISLLLLYKGGYEVGRYISLEKIIEDSKDRYYECLKISSVNWLEGKHNIIPWWEYFCFTLLVAYRQFEDRFGIIESSKGVKTISILSCIKQFHGEFSIQEIQESCPTVGIDLIRKILRHEREERRLECLGRGPRAKWKKLSSTL